MKYTGRVSAPNQRLVRLLLGLLSAAVALEVFCRLEIDALGAVAHRVRFKLALLHANEPLDFVAVGSSRLNDGLQPGALKWGRGFSAATPSSSLPTLEYVASQLGAQRRVLVEVSAPMGTDTPFETEVAALLVPGDPIGAWLSAHSALLQVRRAFALEHLPRALAMMTPQRFDGSEWFRSQWLKQWFHSSSPPDGVSDAAAWAVQPVAITEPTSLDEEGERVAQGYARVVTALRQRGATVILVSPPLAGHKQADECTARWRALRAEVARRTESPLLDWTCAAIDARRFIDGEHLGAPGRAQFSKVLGEALRALP